MPKHLKYVMASAVIALATAFAAPSSAQQIGVAVSNFDDNFLTLLREAMSKRAGNSKASRCSSRMRSAMSAAS